VSSLVDYQVQRWAYEQARLRKEKAKKHWPVITISREFGSLGASIGLDIAKKMGFHFWDQELVHGMAEQSGVDEAMLETLDEHAKDAVSSFIDAVLRRSPITESVYLKNLLGIVHTIGKHGRSVIIGRGAQFILEPHEVHSVRVVCPREQRLQGLMKRRGWDHHEAEKILNEVEHDRHTFIRHHYNRDVSTPSVYDISVNTGNMTADKAVQVIIASYEARYGSPPPPVY